MKSSAEEEIDIINLITLKGVIPTERQLSIIANWYTKKEDSEIITLK